MLLNIKHGDKVLQINAFWLRDHCRCSDCYREDTKQRKSNLLDIPADVQPKLTNYRSNEEEFVVEWSDGHVSSYDINFLAATQLRLPFKIRKSLNDVQTAWNAVSAEEQQMQMHIKLSVLISSEESVKQAVNSLVRFGILFIEEVPANTTMTEMAMRRLFPVMKTFFGEMFTFSDQQIHADTAYTNSYLGAHTDNTYFCDAAGLHSLHCIEHSGDGGANFFVDGLHVVQELKKSNRHAYDLLTQVPVPAEYIEKGEHHRHTAPIIVTDPLKNNFVQLRLNVYDRALFDTLPQEQMEDFYNSYRALLQIVQCKENEWTFKLNPGTYVIFDNWRVLHGRHAYTGLRTMTGCYVQRTDFLSRARIFGLID